MTTIEFDAQVTDGTIEIPAAHRRDVSGPVHVILVPRCQPAQATKIDELLARPLVLAGFRPLTRDEAHDRH
jgi:hypothetical protein